MLEKKVTITDKQEKKYVKGRGTKCLNPDCQNEDLHGDYLEADGGTVTQNIICPVCEWTWTDMYELAGVDRDNIYDESED